MRQLIRSGQVDTAHDCSDGGLALAVAEMAMAGGIGAAITGIPETLPLHAFLFGEDQARYVLAVDPDHATDILYEAKALGVPASVLGLTGGDSLIIAGRRGHIGRRAEGGARGAGCRIYGRQGRVRSEDRMPMDAREIESLIKAALPDATVEIRDLAGDGDHYAATVASSAFKGKSRVQQHQMVYAALRAAWAARSTPLR